MQVSYVRAALEEQANAFVNFAERCRMIYSAQRALIELLPENADIAFLSEGHNSKLRLRNFCFHSSFFKPFSFSSS